MPHKWECSECGHKGWLRSVNTCEACDEVNCAKPIPRESILVIHRAEDGKANAWDDVTGNDLDLKLTIQARKEEMDQFKKHGVYEKVR